jgi:alkylation response protein AidB-like acyl-CoA dehydrogenase
MAIDFAMTPRQRKLKYDAREFAREVLRPVAERADALADPQAAFVAMKPVFEAATALGYTTSFLPAKYGGGGASIVDTLIATEELAAVDGGFPTIVLVNGLALMPLTWYGDEKLCERWIGQAVDPANTGFLGGWVVSERGGTANFDHPSPMAGIQLVARPDKSGDTLVLNGEKHWPCNAGGWDLRGADVNVCIVRTDLAKGGREALSAVLVERDTPGVDYQVIDKLGHRTCQNVTMTFRDVRVPAENLIAPGDGDLVINRTFTWSGPIAGIAAVGVARGAYEFALKWAKTFTGGGMGPIINHQAVGYLLADVAARIEAGRYMCWKAAHYMDSHDDSGHALSGMNKAFCTELMQRAVVDCMRIVGVNALDRRFGIEKSYRESMVFPLYDAGNLAMQQRRAWGVMADAGYTPDLFVDSEPLGFTKSMEGFGLGTEKR